MSKGTIQPWYNKGFDGPYLDDLKSKWVDRGHDRPIDEKIYATFEAYIRQDRIAGV